LTVGYEDLERIPKEILESSTLRITPIAYSSGGQRIDLPSIEIKPKDSEEGEEINDNNIYGYVNQPDYDKYNPNPDYNKDFLLNSFIHAKR
jgi:hypothetical protein